VHVPAELSLVLTVAFNLPTVRNRAMAATDSSSHPADRQVHAMSRWCWHCTSETRRRTCFRQLAVSLREPQQLICQSTRRWTFTVVDKCDSTSRIAVPVLQVGGATHTNSSPACRRTRTSTPSVRRALSVACGSPSRGISAAHDDCVFLHVQWPLRACILPALWPV
jgi:hypothetical protein